MSRADSFPLDTTSEFSVEDRTAVVVHSIVLDVEMTQLFGRLWPGLSPESILIGLVSEWPELREAGARNLARNG